MPKSFARCFGQDLMRQEYIVGTGGGKMNNGLMTVKVSAKMARLPFNGCDPEYIARVCRARCCESSTAPGGTLITIHASEQAAIEAAGGRVVNGMLSANPQTKKCPFKTAADLCGLHFTDHKPLGCIVSPFTLNANGTLIVRNRYKLLKCYDQGPRLPAYHAFRSGLDLIFGPAEAARVCAHLDAGGGDLTAAMPARNYHMLRDNDAAKHAVTASSAAAPTAPGLTWVGGNRDAENLDETSRKILAVSSSGTSIFDPVLCELVYRWFCPPGGLVIDPFAGGSVRGIVAAKLGRRYFGIELRAEQVAANTAQLDILGDDEPAPVWITGDSRNIERHGGEDWPGADFLFSCPPYADLERYSDDPADLSTLGYAEFRAAYREIIAAACRMLKPNAFACFVVGDVRDAKGFYHGFPWHTIDAFAEAGLRLYNEAVLVTAVGSLPIRVGKQFTAARKLGKTHQNVLVFCKGDPKIITQAIGPVDFGENDALDHADQ